MMQEALERSLDRELGWRKKELLTLRANASYATGIEQQTLIRCLVFLSYAHWEGFVKKSANLYFKFILSQNKTYRELADNIRAAELSRRACSDTSKVSYYGEALSFVLYDHDQIADVNTPHDIQDMGMLDSERLRSILYCLVISEDAFELKYNWLDRTLIEERNRVAHGGYLPVRSTDVTGYLSLCDDSLMLIESWHQNMLDSATNRTYVRRPLLPLEGERA